MSRRTTFTTVTPLPAGIKRETVIESLHDHFLMIDLNPLIIERHPIKAPATATPEEFHCQWYSLTDRVEYLPGGLATGKVTYTACFNNLAEGLQTHVYAPLGLSIKGKWTLGGNLPGEPVAPVELGVGVPLTGLYLREDVDMRCNFMLTGFVRANLKKSHAALVEKMVEKAKVTEGESRNGRRLDVGGEQGKLNHSLPRESEDGAGLLSLGGRSRVESWAESTARSMSVPAPGQNARSSSAGHGLGYEEYGEDESLRPRPLSIPRDNRARIGSSDSTQSRRPASQQQHLQAQHNARPGEDLQSLQNGLQNPHSASGQALAELPQPEHQPKRVYGMP